MASDSPLLRAFADLARETAGIDTEVYARFDKDPLEPVIGLGHADSRVGFMGRDPGTDEVRHGEPFIGAGGQLVRKALYECLHGAPLPDFAASQAIGRDFFWANTVPYKPVGNKAWAMSVKKRFHPLMREILVDQWNGADLITLGREAFLWFGIGQDREERSRLEAFWEHPERFEQHIAVTLNSPHGKHREIRLHPLPHPSPLNATWYGRFPGLLRQRLEQLDVRADNLRIR